MMTRDGFIRRLEAGKASNLKYAKDGLVGMINVWKYNEDYIITWEECMEGNQWNESSFTRDEKYVFKNVDEVMRFIDGHSLDISNFKP